MVLILALAGCARVWGGDGADEKEVVAAVQKLFDAMASHSSDAARAVLIPDGRIVAVNEEGAVSGSTQEQFAARLGAMQAKLLERMADPKVTVDTSGRLASLWAEYDFHLDGKLHHCGIDSFSLVKTPGGWKIAGIAYTTRTAGCAPLGPLPKEAH